MANSSDKPKPEPLKSQLALDAARLKAKPTKGSEPDAIFLIGFDTEYEKVDSADPADIKSNRVLSYQYCGRLVEEGGEECDRQWSGIIYPKGHTVEERLSIPEFLHHVIHEGLKRYPALTFPPEIFLIAHFTRADVPGFREFKDKGLRERLLLQNIRSLFMNIQSKFQVNFQTPG